MASDYALFLQAGGSQVHERKPPYPQSVIQLANISHPLRVDLPATPFPQTQLAHHVTVTQKNIPCCLLFNTSGGAGLVAAQLLTALRTAPRRGWQSSAKPATAANLTDSSYAY
jgi:hypothetical protein